MITQPKILIASPISKHKDYILPKWFEYIRMLTYANKEYFFVDNSDTEEYFVNTIFRNPYPFHFNYCKLLPNELIHSRIARSNNLIVEYLLKSNCEYLFMLECDIFPPLDVIERLLKINKKVTAGLYFSKIGNETLMVLGENNILFGKDHNVIDIKIYTPEKSFLFCDGTVKKAHQVGNGCMLIHRSVFDGYKIRFRQRADYTGVEAYADSLFNLDLWLAGIPIYADTSIICNHFNSDWSKILKK